MITASRPTVRARITQIGIFSTLLLAGLLQFGPALADRPPTATDKAFKPQDLFYPPPRVTFDCTAEDTLELAPGLTDTLSGDTTGGESRIAAYPCAGWAEGGPEHIYRLEVVSALELWAGLFDYGGQDFDLFLLSDCDTDSCLVGANEELSAQLSPGTYYLVVDGAGAAEGPYAVALVTRYLGLPPEICNGGAAFADTCGSGPHSYATSTLDRPNLVQTFDCSPIIERGGEVWVALTVEDNTEITARTTSLSLGFDAALWLFDSCEDGAECLAFADDGLGGSHETLIWANLSGETTTVYLAVDSYRAPTNEEQAQIEFEVTCRGGVPVQETSWGGIRARFR